MAEPAVSMLDSTRSTTCGWPGAGRDDGGLTMRPGRCPRGGAAARPRRHADRHRADAGRGRRAARSAAGAAALCARGWRRARDRHRPAGRAGRCAAAASRRMRSPASTARRSALRRARRSSARRCPICRRPGSSAPSGRWRNMPGALLERKAHGFALHYRRRRRRARRSSASCDACSMAIAIGSNCWPAR